MFDLFGSSDSRRLKQLYEGFHSEMSTLQSLPDIESQKVLAAIGLYLREFMKNPLFGDVRNVAPDRGNKLVADFRALVRETMKQSPIRGHALTLIGMYIEAHLLKHVSPIGASLHSALGEVLDRGEQAAAGLPALGASPS